MSDIDRALDRIARQPIPPELESLDRRVVVRLSSKPSDRAGFRAEALAIGAALIVGVAMTALPRWFARPSEQSPISLGGAPPPGPSVLLADLP